MHTSALNSATWRMAHGAIRSTGKCIHEAARYWAGLGPRFSTQYSGLGCTTVTVNWTRRSVSQCTPLGEMTVRIRRRLVEFVGGPPSIHCWYPSCKLSPGKS